MVFVWRRALVSCPAKALYTLPQLLCQSYDSQTGIWQLNQCTAGEPKGYINKDLIDYITAKACSARGQLNQRLILAPCFALSFCSTFTVSIAITTEDLFFFRVFKAFGERECKNFSSWSSLSSSWCSPTLCHLSPLQCPGHPSRDPSLMPF